VGRCLYARRPRPAIQGRRMNSNGVGNILEALIALSSNAMSSLPRTCRYASSEIQIPPGSAIPSSRAAIFTPSPKMSSPSKMTSPRLIPMRNSMRRSSTAFCSFGGNAPLDFRRAMHRIHHACKFDQESVARGFYDSTARFRDSGVDERRTKRFESRVGPFLVGTHKPAVTCDICRQDCFQPPFNSISGQIHCSQKRRAS
jgi:hypothetical protein